MAVGDITLSGLLLPGGRDTKILESDNVALSQYTGNSTQEDKLTKKLHDIDTAVSSKQDTIDDLDDIRTKAAAGATAVQPSALTTALSSKQDTIENLEAIKTGAAAGATAVQPSALTTALSSKQDKINDLSTIRSGAEAGATAVQPAALNNYAQKSEVPSNTVDLVFTLEGGTQQTIKVYVQE